MCLANQIPFHFTKTQQAVLKKIFDERFNIQNNVAFLCPPNGIACLSCGNECSEKTICRESVIVTETNGKRYII